MALAVAVAVGENYILQFGVCQKHEINVLNFARVSYKRINLET